MATMYYQRDRQGRRRIRDLRTRPDADHDRSCDRRSRARSARRLCRRKPAPLGCYNQHIDQAPLVTATGAHYISRPQPCAHDRTMCATPSSSRARSGVRSSSGVPLDVQKQSLGRAFAYTPSAAFIPVLSTAPPNPRMSRARSRRSTRPGKSLVPPRRSRCPTRGSATRMRTPRRRLRRNACNDLAGARHVRSSPLRPRHRGRLRPGGGQEALQEADLIIAIGASLSNFTADAGSSSAMPRSSRSTRRRSGSSMA